MSIESQTGIKIDAQSFQTLSGVKVLPRIDTAGLTSFPSRCFVPKRINFVFSGLISYRC